MLVPNWIPTLFLLLFLASMLLWAIPWNQFTTAAKRTKYVEELVIRQTAIKVGSGALCSGLMFAVVGFLIESDSGVVYSVPLLLLGLITIPIGFTVLILGAFLMKAAALRALYNSEESP